MKSIKQKEEKLAIWKV